jgi:hypothetical protein
MGKKKEEAAYVKIRIEIDGNNDKGFELAIVNHIFAFIGAVVVFVCGFYQPQKKLSNYDYSFFLFLFRSWRIPHHGGQAMSFFETLHEQDYCHCQRHGDKGTASTQDEHPEHK